MTYNPVRRGRLWFYGPDSYEGMLPVQVAKGGDEFGRRTVFLTVRRVGSIVFAYRTCYCVDCAEARAQTERLEFEMIAAQAYYGLTEQEFWDSDLSQEQIDDAIDAHHHDR